MAAHDHAGFRINHEAFEGTVKLTLREHAGAAGMTSQFESRGARDGVPSEERATP